MKIAKLMISSVTVLSSMLPLITHAASSSLNGWGDAFLKAHTQSLSMASSSADGAVKAGLSAGTELAQSQTTATANISGSVQAGLELSQSKAKVLVNDLSTIVDSTYTQAGTQVDTLLSSLDNTVASLGQTLSSGLSVEQSSNIASTLNLGKIATLNSGLVTNSVLQQTAGSSVAQVLSLSTGILQSIVGSRPATLTGLLR